MSLTTCCAAPMLSGSLASTFPLTRPVNLRDFGGIPLKAGRIRYGFAVRADDLSLITFDDVAALVRGGLTTVIDLRSIDEVELTGRGLLGQQIGISYHHLPFLSPTNNLGNSDGEYLPNPAQRLSQDAYGEMYLRIFEGDAAAIVSALSVIAYAPGAVAFYCAAGQDRTGILAAALLLVLGADPDEIVADYAVTGNNLGAIKARILPMVGPLMMKLGLKLDNAAKAALRSSAFTDEPMRYFLKELVARHGDPLVPLRLAGLTDGLVAQLRAKALGESACHTP